MIVMALFWDNPAFGSNPRTPKDPKTMTPAEINRELDKLDTKRSALNDEFIAAGRGNETANETWKKTDPLALRWRAVSERMADLRNEISLRYGPGAPSRMPRGFGRRDRYNANPDPVVISVHQVLAGAYRGRGRRDSCGNLEGRTLLTHAVVVDSEGRWIEDKSVCRRIGAETLCDVVESRGTLPTCPTCRERVQRRGYLY